MAQFLHNWSWHSSHWKAGYEANIRPHLNSESHTETSNRFSDLAIKWADVYYYFYNVHLIKENSNKLLAAGKEVRANR